jgi:hypothetical protein
MAKRNSFQTAKWRLYPDNTKLGWRYLPHQFSRKVKQFFSGKGAQKDIQKGILNEEDRAKAALDAERQRVKQAMMKGETITKAIENPYLHYLTSQQTQIRATPNWRDPRHLPHSMPFPAETEQLTHPESIQDLAYSNIHNKEHDSYTS